MQSGWGAQKGVALRVYKLRLIDLLWIRCATLHVLYILIRIPPVRYELDSLYIYIYNEYNESNSYRTGGIRVIYRRGHFAPNTVCRRT